MAALTVSPNPAPPSSVVSVAGSSFANAKTRLLLDGAGATTNIFRPRRDGTFNVGLTVGSTVQTQTLVAQQASGSAWIEAARTTISVQAVATPPATPATTVDPGITPAAFLALLNDLSVSRIVMNAGTYPKWQLYARVHRPSTAPLLVQPNGIVTFDGAGRPTSTNGAFYFGANEGLSGTPTSSTSYITFSGLGTGGHFRCQNYTLGSTGIVVTGWIDHLEFSDVEIVNCTGTVANQSHGLYAESDGAHRSSVLTADRWIFKGPSSRLMDPFQSYHTPGIDGVHLRDWRVDQAWRAAYLWGDSTGIDIDGWVISNSNDTFDNSAETATGVIRNCTAYNAGPLAAGSGRWTGTGITDGGGNRVTTTAPAAP